MGEDKNSAVRSRFDLAHELGYLIMHRNINQDDLLSKEILDRIETEVDMFAAAFLLPLGSFVFLCYYVSVSKIMILF